ncbi:acetate--CoA ligase family protein [Bordetella bronchiseptica]|uniref:acetate--CoA ligase family protein n=2 Tax=Bordetella bronchiseptica TaxID=518 RepID=UPI00045A6524|nr:acetate--CoA ligase family protein [Bordetella bronchiseptica]AZW33061.1 CoA-binding protein [Bordetella bronchiseptica]KCV42191.1 succinyl-CoA ligase-like flavodoxin domain protein [Bordetella bronchiseptica 345]KDC17078.1 succinyl-CoA ligase-like flavodoxin domain protein [Bordetella bronchiseptica F-1]KDC40285.1 succinyl-CoA ligase-like flavodoxin domain protein [Bordetella bronchiseptica GA96-01]
MTQDLDMAERSVAAPQWQGAARAAAVLEARSVAIVGASADPGKIAGRPLAYMLSRGFVGKLFPVNPTRAQVQGVKSYPSLAAIGEPVDLAIVGTPAALVEGVIREGIAAGVRAFVVFSSGFSETGEAGAALQRRLGELARAHDVTILGPNCLGVANSATGLIASFTTALEETPIRQGGFALVSQSGALGAYWMDICLRSGLGFSKWITTGNECDMDAAAAIAYLAGDADTRVIGLYVEDIRDTVAFRRALRAAAEAGKPVIAIKAGRSQAGAAAAASHTGALAGDDALYDACLRQHGALRVDSLGQMMDAARLYLFDSVPQGRRIAVMSVSGGAGVLIADEAERWGLALPPLAEHTASALAPVLPSFVQAANPLDLTGNVVQDTASIGRALEAVARDPGNDAIVLFVGLMHSIASAFTDAIAQARQRTHRPIIVIWIGAKEESVAALEQARIPVFRDIPPAVAAVGAAVRLQALREAALAMALPAAAPPAARAGRIEALAECDGKALLRELGAAGVPAGVLVAGPAPERLPAPLAYPVVAKLQAASLLHKSDIGGVVLGIASDQQLREAVQRLGDIAREHGIEARGVLVEPMQPFDHELLLGLRRDPRFGATLTLGRGGVEVELDADVASQLLPLSAGAIQAMLESLRAARLFKGFRGRGAVDLAALSSQIADLCRIFLEQPDLAEVEVNPLAVRGDRAWVLDAVVSRYA